MVITPDNSPFGQRTIFYRRKDTMLTILTVVGVAIALAFAILLALAARRPDTFSYERSVVIGAPAERIFPLIADPVVFNTWNPFNEEPSIKGTYSGPPRGPGARYTF